MVTRPEPASILVAEDVPDSREVLGLLLKRQGHRVVYAENGGEALDRVRAGGLDLVLLDIMMPVMDGYEVLRRLKAEPDPARVPVVVVSAVHEVDSVARCVQLGAADYLFKPFNPVLLKARVDACLEQKRLRDGERQHLARLAAEQERSERLLLSIFPKSVAEQLKGGRAGTIAESYPDATVLFADLNGFSQLAALRPPAAVVELLDRYFSAFDGLAERHGVEKVKTVGDTYIAVAGLPEPRADHAEAIAELALSMQQVAARVDTGLGEPLSLRVGVNTGPVVAGVIGTRRFAYDLWGQTVAVAGQMEAFGLAGSIQVTAATYERLKDKYLFEERGAFYVQGGGEVETYLLRGRKGPRPGERAAGAAAAP